VLQVRYLRELPPVSSAELRALVTQQVGRFFRHNGAAVVADARWMGRRNGHRARTAVAGAVEAQVLAALLDASLSGGFEVYHIRADGHEGLDLRPASMREAERVRERRKTRRLAALALLLWLSVLAVGVGRFVSERHAVLEELNALAAPLDAIRRARSGMDRAQQELEALDQAARERGRLARAVLKLADALPDSAIITAASLDATGRGLVSGVAARSLDVVARLERSGAMHHPRLTGDPIPVDVKGAPWERFTVASDTADPP
jgi:hypothetical protein